jgi:hypothetical protein
MKIRLVAISTIAGMFLGVGPSSLASDFTDTTGPVVNMKLIQGLPSKGNATVFEVVAQDEKNEIKNESIARYISIGFDSNVTSGVAPACFSTSITSPSSVGVQLIPMQQQSLKLPSGWYESKFTLIIYVAPLVKLPQGCPEWRQGIYFNFNISITDSVGNSSKVFDELPPWRTNRAPISPFMDQLNPKNATDTSGYCFMPLYSKEQKEVFSSNLAKYQNQIERHRGKSYSQTILTKFDETYPNFLYASEHLQRSQTLFDLDQFRNLAMCKNVNLPGITPDEAIFINTGFELSRAESQDRAVQEAEAKTRAAVELKAKQEAEARTAAELKAKQEADAKAAAELKAKQEADAKAAAAKKKTIICTKGKLTRKVTAVKPKCLAGYKVKR